VKKPTKVERIDPADCAIGASARKALEEVLSRDPSVLLIVYETEAQVGYASVPASSAVALGLHLAVGGLLMPETE
jgi:hypothetical protein